MPRALKAIVRQAPAWVQPEALNVAPSLVGLALATPLRRALAMGVDLVVVTMLADVSGLWLVAGLLLVVLQLRSGDRASAARRLAVGWVGAVLIGLLVLQEGLSRWEAHLNPRPPAAVDRGDGAADSDIDDELEVAGRQARRALKALRAASAASDAQVAALETALVAAQAQVKALAQQARHPPPTGWRADLKALVAAFGDLYGWGVVYFSLLPAWWGGQTVGKKLFGLAVVELTGKPMTVLRCLKRYGGYAAGMATGGLGFVQLLWDDNRQAIQDKAAHTVVIDRRAPARPVAAFALPSAEPPLAPPPTPD